MQQIGRRGFLMATGAAGLLATGLGAPRMARAASADIGIASPDPIYCVSYVAFKNGYFKDAGLEANYIDTQSGPRGKQMLAAGQVFATTSGTNDAIALPLLGIYLVVNIFEFRSLRSQTIRDINERVTRLATLYAQQFEGELQTIAQIADSAAEFISIDPDLGRRDPWTILEKNVSQNRLVYGSALAWIPDAEHPEPESPFVFRPQDGGTRRIDIASEAYDYRQSEWFTLPIELGTGVWTEPYFDEGAGDILMCTYATPVRSGDGAPIAVVTVDLPLEALQDAMQLDELNQGVFMIISREDRFISHPAPWMIMEVKLKDLIEQHGNPTAMRELHARIRSDEIGSSEYPLMIADESYWIAFAPIPSTQWSLIASFPSDDVLAPVYEDLYRDVIGVGIGLAANLIAIFVLALLFTRPIRRLSSAMAAALTATGASSEQLGRRAASAPRQS